MNAKILRLQSLRCCLFQEAHKMVREANVKQATAEKQLKEAQGKVSLRLQLWSRKAAVITVSRVPWQPSGPF